MNLYISYSPAIKSRFLIVLFMICHYSVVIISAQVSSVSQSCLTLCGPMNCSTPGHKHQRGELLTVLQGRNNNLRNVIGSWLHFWSWYGGNVLRNYYDVYVCVCVQSCLTLCNPVDCSPPDSSVHGIFQARTLEQAAISYPRRSSQPRDWTRLSCISCISRRVLHHSATWETNN